MNTGSNDGVIVLNYRDVDVGNSSYNNGASATVGIKAFDTQSPNRLLVSYNSGSNPLIESEKAIRITSLADAPPPTASIAAVSPDPRTAVVDTMTITFSEPVTGLDLADLTLGRDGGANLLTGAQTLVTSDAVTWTLENLSPLTQADGRYELTLNSANAWVKESAWNVLATDAVTSWTMDTSPPAPSGLSPADDAVGVPADTSLAITFGEPIRKGTGSIVLKQASDAVVVETIDVAGAGVSVSGATATIVPSVTLAMHAGYYVEVAAGAFQDAAGNDFAGLSGSTTWNFTTHALQITTLLPTASGLVAAFNGPLDTTPLNLYDGAGGGLGPPDLTVRDGAGKSLSRALVADDTSRTVEWIATGGVLPPDTYTVSLTSGVRAFRDAEGNSRDGDADGAPGGDYLTQFTVNSAGDRILSIPDIARGAGQPVNVPVAATGWPIRLDNAAAVTSLALDLRYDSAVLTVTGASLAAGLPGDWRVAPPDTGTPGLAKISASGTTPLTGTNVEVIRLTAAVPDTAPYGASRAIRLENVSLNGGAIAAIGDVAVHKAAYLGDADGSGIHSAADAFLVVQAALGLASGFAAHAWTDPRIVGDADGSGVLSAADAFLIVQEGLGLSEPFVPDNPRVPLTPVGGGVDPQFRIDTAIPAAAGGVVTVPARLDIEAAATNVGGIDFELFFNPDVLTIDVPQGVAGGADTAAGWALSAQLVAPGQLRVGLLGGQGQPLAAGLREIALLQFHVAASLRDAGLAGVSRRHVAELHIEPIDPRAGGYTWTAVDGSLAIAAGDAGPRERGLADLLLGNCPLDSLLDEFAGEVASIWQASQTGLS